MCGNRTHLSRLLPGHYGFEVREAHQVPFHSQCIELQNSKFFNESQAVFGFKIIKKFFTAYFNLTF